MARIRSLKPSVWTDERFIDLSRDARLLFIGMVSQADDDGRFVASGAALIGALFPHDDLSPKTVEKWRDEISATGLIQVYRHGRGTYAALPGWRKHQRIQKPQQSSLPAPPESRTQSRTESRTGLDAQGLSQPAPTTPDNTKYSDVAAEIGRPTTPDNTKYSDVAAEIGSEPSETDRGQADYAASSPQVKGVEPALQSHSRSRTKSRTGSTTEKEEEWEKEGECERERERENATDVAARPPDENPSTTDVLLSDHLAALDSPPPTSVRADLERRIRKLLLAGSRPEHVAAGLAKLRRKQLSPRLLDQLVAESIPAAEPSELDPLAHPDAQAFLAEQAGSTR